jgi:hypothetical protein
MSLPNEYGLGSLSDCFARCPDTNAEVTDQFNAAAIEMKSLLGII